MASSLAAVLRATRELVEPGQQLAGRVEQGPIVGRNLDVAGRVGKGCAAPFGWHRLCFTIDAWSSSQACVTSPGPEEQDAGSGVPLKSAMFRQIDDDFCLIIT